MNRTMDCEQFARELDSYLDGEMNAEQGAAFREHAHTCAACGAQLAMAAQIVSLCAKLDEGVQMPIEGQAAWRRAVRDEATTRGKAGRMARLWRGASNIAAALLILAGGTYAYRVAQPAGTMMQVASEPAAVSMAKNEVFWADEYDAEEAEALSAAPMVNRAAGTSDILLTDGGMHMSVADEEDVYTGAIDENFELPQIEESGFAPDVDVQSIKEIRYASRDIQSSEYDRDFEMVCDLIDEYRGRIDDESGYGAPLSPTNTEGRRVYLSARIPSEDLDAFLTALDVVGTIAGRSQSRREITRQYYDTAARLESQIVLLEKLQSMVGDAQDVSEMIEIQRELAEVGGQINSLQSQIRGWDGEIGYATVSINMEEVADKAAVQAIDTQTLAGRLNEGFVQSINMLGTFAQDMLVFVAMFWPWILLALVAVIAARMAAARHRRKR